MVLDCFNCLSPLATHPSASSRKWVQFKVAPASRGLWVLPTLIHRCPGHLHCLKAYDKEPEGLQWSDFNPFTWFDVPPEVMRVLAEEEKRAALEDDGWGSGDWEEDWLDDEPKRIRTRPGPSEKGRDSWLKPTLDMGGVWDRMVFNGDDEEVEKRLEMEWQRNQEESRVALKFLGFVISRALSGPLWSTALHFNEHAFDPTRQQKLEGAKEIHKEGLKLEMRMAYEDAEALPEDILKFQSKKAHELNDEFIERNKQAMLNVLSDSISGLVLFIIVLYADEGMEALFSTGGRLFGGLSDTAKAFLIILVADILLGYHSEEGWTAALRLIAGHYGDYPEEETVSIVVATLPVFLDTCFKYWIFKGLNRQSPAAAVTLKTMNRH